MKKLMTLALALVLTFTLAAVGFADSAINKDGTWTGDVSSDGAVTITASASVPTITNVQISWTNNWSVTYSWAESGVEGAMAWTASVATDGGANVLSFEAQNYSPSIKAITAAWTNAEVPPTDLGLQVAFTNFLAEIEEGYNLLNPYDGSVGGTIDSATCSLTLSECDHADTRNDGEADFYALDESGDELQLGTLTFTVLSPM